MQKSVRDTLESAHRMTEVGNEVHFGSELCFVERSKTGKRIPIIERNGMCEVGGCVPRACRKQSQQATCQSIEPDKRSDKSHEQCAESVSAWGTMKAPDSVFQRQDRGTLRNVACL